MKFLHIKEIAIESIDEILEFRNTYGKFGDVLKECVFRGESDYRYQLLPNILRADTLNNVLSNHSGGIGEFTENKLNSSEYKLLSDFYRVANINGLYVPEKTRFNEYLNSNNDMGHFIRFDHPEKWLPKDLYEITGLAQHYGVPTRLIDWTSSYKVALYFATSSLVKKTSNRPKYFTLWALNIERIDGHNFTNSKFPVKIIRPIYKNNENLRAQKGLFTLYEIDKPFCKQGCKSHEELMKSVEEYNRKILIRPFDELLEEAVITEYSEYNFDWPEKTILYKFIISSNLDKEILSMLHYEGVNGASIFPGYNGVTKTVEELKYINDSVKNRL